MGLFEGLLGGAPSAAGALGTSTGLQNAADIGQGLTGLARPFIARGAQREAAKTRRMIAEINAKRTAREARYAQGLASVQNAGAGGGQYGSFLFTIADNARAAEERIQDEYLTARRADIAEKATIPTLGAAAFDFSGSLARAGARNYLRGLDQSITDGLYGSTNYQR